MNPIQSNKLTLLPFPQKWEDGFLTIRAIVLPRGNPLQKLIKNVPGLGDGPAFADASNLRLQAMLIPGLDDLPNPVNVSEQIHLDVVPPANMRAIYEELANQFDIDPALEASITNQRRSGRQLKKLLVKSYQNAFAFSTPRTPYAVMDDSYACALRNACNLNGASGPPPNPKTVWGKVIAQALRMPQLSAAMGLMYEIRFKPTNPDIFKDGGWLYLSLDDGTGTNIKSDYYDLVTNDSTLIEMKAARIPALDGDRSLFAPLLFPVGNVPLVGNFDELFREVALYDDGFAKIVHCAQQTTGEPAGIETASAPPAVIDTGVQLGWDDEQILIWMNRQIADETVETREAPLGVMGYRVDVRENGTNDWFSMMRTQADLTVGPVGIGEFNGELTVEVHPGQFANQEDGDYWLPAYYTQWDGKSIVTKDSTGLQLSGISAADAADRYQAVMADQVPLRYGKKYDFRIRLSDISGGGPSFTDNPANPAVAPIAECDFRRFVRPREVRIANSGDINDQNNPPSRIEVLRPLVHYPTAVYTGIPDAENLLINDLATIANEVVNGSSGREPGLADPDVITLEIKVQVRSLEFDPSNVVGESIPLKHLYTTQRTFPVNTTDALHVDISYVDIADVDDLVPSDVGPVELPTSRDIVLTLTPIGKDDPNLEYFGSKEVQVGRSTDIELRKNAIDEREIFVPDALQNRLRAFFIQADEVPTKSIYAKLKASGKGEEAETDATSRLATELNLVAKGAKLLGKPGRRIVFGASKDFSHIMAPDHSSITFSSKADITERWVIATKLLINRDWTWNGQAPPLLKIERDGVEVGRIQLPKSVSPVVFEEVRTTGVEPDRSFTEILFFDALDPKSTPPDHPEEQSLNYTITAVFKTDPLQKDVPLDMQIDLPIAANPTQTPKLLSAGVALSPYLRAEDYSSTESRQQLLWIEFDKAPSNPSDIYYGRVLSYAPDPMLTRGEVVDVPPETPLPIDPEFIRIITPGQSDDKAGLNAMQELIPTNSPRHFLLPLPEGLNKSSKELFGFFVYEFRVGHKKGWSTAQARFGPALRVNGIQHPAPALHCISFRTDEYILGSAPFAVPIFKGRSLLPNAVATEMWILLYAQVKQSDNEESRNILIGRKQAFPDRQNYDIKNEIDYYGSTRWTTFEIEQILDSYVLPPDTSLSILAMELLPDQQRFTDPLGQNLGQVRALRSSNLVKVPAVCIQPPCLTP